MGDIFITSNSPILINIPKNLHFCLCVKDLGKFKKTFLALRLLDTNKGLLISPQIFAEYSARFRQSWGRSYDFPMEQNYKAQGRWQYYFQINHNIITLLVFFV